MNSIVLGFGSVVVRQTEATSCVAGGWSGVAAQGEYVWPDESWEPPTREQWRRALRAVVMNAVRQTFGNGLCWRPASDIYPSVTRH